MGRPAGADCDVLALTGDSVDNIPGIGIGRKSAAALISEFGGLEPLLNNIDKVKSGVPARNWPTLATRYCKTGKWSIWTVRWNCLWRSMICESSPIIPP